MESQRQSTELALVGLGHRLAIRDGMERPDMACSDMLEET